MSIKGKRSQITGAVRITVSLDAELGTAVMHILSKSGKTERERCNAIRELLRLALGMKAHMFVVRLGALSAAELKALSDNAQSVSNDSWRIVNALRNLQSLDAHQETVAEEWRTCIRSCIRTLDLADQLVADISGKLRSRVDPPQFVIATVRTLHEKLRREATIATDPAARRTRENLLQELESYLKSIEPLCSDAAR